MLCCTDSSFTQNNLDILSFPFSEWTQPIFCKFFDAFLVNAYEKAQDFDILCIWRTTSNKLEGK